MTTSAYKAYNYTSRASYVGIASSIPFRFGHRRLHIIPD